ncbi:HK97-gp10 family putative phage morphogenesis protein [Micromonospora sp. NPDC005652]|uniref:HK97-gp10 family putative phage morphogenesis protein n=1 Tax=Micromonospora sp. NPDC005652 TaxID=3157046 RepID=UPI0033FE66FE
MKSDNRPLRPQDLAALTRSREVVDKVRGLANAIRRDARQLAPKETGRLGRNLQVERAYDPATGRVSYLVGWGPGGFYGWMVESGTQDEPPRPHLVPAAVKHGATSARGGAS